jgi:hypothetical protein
MSVVVLLLAGADGSPSPDAERDACAGRRGRAIAVYAAAPAAAAGRRTG